jgi:hypothetical protein
MFSWEREKVFYFTNDRFKLFDGPIAFNGQDRHQKLSSQECRGKGRETLKIAEAAYAMLCMSPPSSRVATNAHLIAERNGKALAIMKASGNGFLVIRASNQCSL